MDIRKKYAKDFLRKYNLTSQTLTVERLISILESMGFRVFKFNPNEPNQTEIKLIHQATTDEQLMESKAFYFVNEYDTKDIFIEYGQNDDDIILLLLHEIGHIYCDTAILRNLIEDTPVQKEADANEFMSTVLRILNKKTDIEKVLHVAFVAFLRVAYKYVLKPYILTHTQAIENLKRERSIDVTSESVDESVEDIVVVTEVDNKYHSPDCKYVNNDDNIKYITADEANELNYIECSECKQIIESNNK